jgi:hypothetical protein
LKAPRYDPELPTSRQLPQVLPYRHKPFTSDPYRGSSEIRMQPYQSIGSKEGVIWLSAWISPAMSKTAGWSYLPEPSSGSWFPPLERTRNERFQSSTLRIPHWMIISTYTLCWLACMAWRGRRRKKRLGRMAAELQSAGVNPSFG